MKIRNFSSIDTLLIEFNDAPVTKTRDLDADTLLDLDANGNICAITIEGASKRTDIPRFPYEQVTV